MSDDSLGHEPFTAARGAPAATRRSIPPRPVRDWILAVVTLCAISAAIVGTYIPDQEPLSPFDEWVYLDYVDKLTRLGLPQTGESIDRASLVASSCRGVFVWGPTGSPCGGPYVPSEYPMGGITSADVHPPTYFAANALLAAVLRGVGVSDDLLTSNRMVGALWLAAGLVLVAGLARLLGAPLLAATGAAAVLASLPLIRYNNSYITPDAMNVIVGAGVLITALLISRGRWPWWAMIAAGAFAGAVKTQNGLVVGAGACFLLWRVLCDRRSSGVDADHRLIWAAVGGVVAYVGAQLGWILTRRILSVGPSPEQGVEIPLTFNLAIRETAAFVLRLGLGATEDGLAVPTYAYFALALMLAGCVGAVFYRPWHHESWGLAASVTLLVIIGSPVLLVAELIAAGGVVPSPTRYGASLLAGVFAVLATAFSSRLRSAALASTGGAMVVIVVVDNLLR
jgi:hypothetical protein